MKSRRPETDKSQTTRDTRDNATRVSKSSCQKSSRDTHCLLGVPIDIVTMHDVVTSIRQAARTSRRLFISTPNLNFIALAQRDSAFRASLLRSDLCLADGIAVQLIGKLLGVPIGERVAGSDILNAFWEAPEAKGDTPLKVFFFGGTEDAGQKACRAVNLRAPEKIVCVGSLCPGFGTLEDMSIDEIIDSINSAHADFLIVALGARKGQAWIMHNIAKLNVPVISHLGATINFTANTLKRAPASWQKLGLEWLWRIRQEPQLASRYWNDGWTLVRLLFTRIAPTSIWLAWNRWRWRSAGFSMDASTSQAGQTELVLKGNFTSSHVEKFERIVADALIRSKFLSLDLSAVNWVDTKAMGSLLLLPEVVRNKGGVLNINDSPSNLQWVFRFNGLQDLSTE